MCLAQSQIAFKYIYLVNHNWNNKKLYVAFTHNNTAVMFYEAITHLPSELTVRLMAGFHQQDARLLSHKAVQQDCYWQYGVSLESILTWAFRSELPPEMITHLKKKRAEILPPLCPDNGLDVLKMWSEYLQCYVFLIFSVYGKGDFH